MADFHVQLYRLDDEGRIRPDGGEEIVEADDAAEAVAQLSSEVLTTTPAEGRFAAKVWTVVDYTAVSVDFFRA